MSDDPHAAVYGAVLQHLGLGEPDHSAPLLLRAQLLDSEEALSSEIVDALSQRDFMFRLTDSEVRLDEFVDLVAFSKIADLGTDRYSLEVDVLMIRPERMIFGHQIRATFLVRCTPRSCDVIEEVGRDHSTLVPSLGSDSIAGIGS